MILCFFFLSILSSNSIPTCSFTVGQRRIGFFSLNWTSGEIKEKREKNDFLLINWACVPCSAVEALKMKRLFACFYFYTVRFGCVWRISSANREFFNGKKAVWPGAVIFLVFVVFFLLSSFEYVCVKHNYYWLLFLELYMGEWCYIEKANIQPNGIRTFIFVS